MSKSTVLSKAVIILAFCLFALVLMACLIFLAAPASPSTPNFGHQAAA
jgi:hypothetical protein